MKTKKYLVILPYRNLNPPLSHHSPLSSFTKGGLRGIILLFPLLFLSVSIVTAKAVSLAETPGLSAQDITIIRFQNKSGYEGKWDIEKGMTRLFKERLGEIIACVEINTSPRPSLLELAQAGKEKSLVTANIEEFSLGSQSVFMGLFSMLGPGYKRYKGRIKMSMKIVKDTDVFIIPVESEFSQGGLGIGIVAAPEEKFKGLEKYEFGSTEFMESVMGKALDKAIGQMIAKVEEHFPVAEKRKRVEDIAQILEIKEDIVYLNIGHAKGINKGEEFSVYRREEKTGRIKITEIIGAYLSQAKIIEGKDQIKVLDTILTR